MRQSLDQLHRLDENGNPMGGFTSGRGISIYWQNGPLSFNGERREPNGAFVEDVISAAIGRLEHYQSTKFACPENGAAIDYLNAALDELEARTADREARGVEGTHAV